MAPNLFHFLVLTVAGWLQRERQAAIAYLQAENAVLRRHVPRGPGIGATTALPSP